MNWLAALGLIGLGLYFGWQAHHVRSVGEREREWWDGYHAGHEDGSVMRDA